MLDITLHDILPLQCIFAFHGDPVVLGGEFRQQALPVAEGSFTICNFCSAS
jgi:hypothetical protein